MKSQVAILTFACGGQRVPHISQVHFDLFQRAITAIRAISDLRFAESFLARALPPLRPPSLPNATAAGFFSLSLFMLERLRIAG